MKAKIIADLVCLPGPSSLHIVQLIFKMFEISYIRYIGVFGKPENDQKAALAMTAPVITQSNLIDIPAYTMRSTDKQSMTMQFVLPFHLKSINEVPVPINSKVVIRAIPSRIIAVTKFSGAYSSDSCNKQFTKLKSSLVAHKLLRQKAANTDETDPTVKWSGKFPLNLTLYYSTINFFTKQIFFFSFF